MILLVAAIGGAWYASRWWRHRDDLRATLVLSDAGGVERGAHVVHDSLVIGQVTNRTRLDDSDALSLLVKAEHRGQLLRDSMVSIEDGAVVVDNRLAVGRRLEDGDVLRIRDDSVRRWIAKQKERLTPLVDRVREMARKNEIVSLADLDRLLEDWKREIPRWKKEGKAGAERHVAELDESVTKLETALRKRGREDDARKLREKYESLLDELKEER